MIPIAKPILGQEEAKAILAVLRSGMIAMGETVTQFEQEFGKMFGYKQVIATSSGTTALQAALHAHGIGPGDEVITTPFTFIATANSILSTGAKPVFVDIDEKTYNLDPPLIEKKITSKTKAILPVHLYGLPANMPAISQIAKKHKLVIIEDACQAHGAKIGQKFVGSWGTAVFSLYPTKNITSGEGGLVTTDKPKIAEKVRLFINHGQKVRYHHTHFGLNFRLTNLHAAIGLAQLKKLKKFTQKRQANAQYFISHLQNVSLPTAEKGYEHVYHLFTIRLSKNRDLFAKKLNQASIGTGIHYPIPIHQQPYYRKLGYGRQKLLVAEKAARQVLSLPVHPGVSRKELKYIVKTVNQITSAKK